MTTGIDLFGGPGGWDYGARALGVHVLGLDDDAWVCRTRRAAGLPTYQADVAGTLPAIAASLAPRLLLGSPPCQTFSKAGYGEGFRSRDRVIEVLTHVAVGAEPGDFPDLDARTRLVLEPMRWLRVLQPAWIALEQVPAVLPIWQAYAALLRDRFGYHAEARILSAEQYGVPQTRRRAFLLARRDHPVTWPQPTHRAYRKGVGQHDPEAALRDPDLQPWVSMAEGIGWGMTHRPYPTLSPGATSVSGADAMLLGGGHARQIVKDEWEAGRWRLKSQYGVPRNTRPLHEPAFTVTSHVGRNMWQHRTGGEVDEADWYSVRRISIVEAAVLQSFPPDYPWDLSGGVTRAYGQIGSAVPPRLSAHVLAHLLGRDVRPALAELEARHAA